RPTLPPSRRKNDRGGTVSICEARSFLYRIDYPGQKTKLGHCWPARCRHLSADDKVTADASIPIRAKNSLHGLHRQRPDDLPVSRPALAPVAIPVATVPFQCPTPARTEFCALDSGFCDRSSRNVADSDRDCHVGGGSTRRITELVSPANLGRSDRDVPFNGLRVLVVALGHAHGAVLLAVSQRASYRPRSRCEHSRAISLR